MYLVQHFFEQHGKHLGLELLAGAQGLSRKIHKAEVHRPGLSLTGYLKGFVFSRILVFGKQEIEFLRELDPSVRMERLKVILTTTTPAVIVSRGLTAPKEMIAICEAMHIPLFRATSTATNLLSRVAFLLLEEFCPSVTLHGTLVEVFGVGVLIQGESSVGKSEAALGLIERGHRLISDDVVRVKKKEGAYLVGSGPDLTRHLMEIRGIGIINVAHLYGAVCVRPDKGIDIVVKLEEWDDQHFYDRVGLDEKFIDVLGVSVPYHLLPVKPGRDVVLLLETIALNHRLKDMGYNSAKEFNAKLLETIARRKKKTQERMEEFSR
ncbi:MAG: HPr kinase/phosphorylase [Verrucomicrobia bacterium]|nr:HPr kinase/phosphorylase [Verrucomicrobiota bacterium]MDE3047493.1 HPr kinase/phosphorylase [Verrucomicrobiota bacterium]